MLFSDKSYKNFILLSFFDDVKKKSFYHNYDKRKINNFESQVFR